MMVVLASTGRFLDTTPAIAAVSRTCAALALAMLVVTISTQSPAAGPTLVLSADGATRTFDRDALLARSDVVEITTLRDVAYGAHRTYRAVPLAHLMEGIAMSADTVLEAVARDGFVAQLPRDLIEGGDREAVPYVAIETADAPWPSVPGKDASAGPFYIVWLGVRASTVPAVDWPYQVVSLSEQDAPTKRWPSLAVDPMLSALDAGAGRTNPLCDQVLYLPYPEPRWLGISWPRSERPHEPH
jgi:hypothetical protein